MNKEKLTEAVSILCSIKDIEKYAPHLCTYIQKVIDLIISVEKNLKEE